MAVPFRGAPAAGVLIPGFGGGAGHVPTPAARNQGATLAHMNMPGGFTGLQINRSLSNRQYREMARMGNARFQGPIQTPAPGSYPDELVRAVKNKGAGKYTKNMAGRNAYQIEQIMGIRKIHDPDDRDLLQEHTFQYIAGNKKMLAVLKRIKQLTRETQSRASHIADLLPEELRDAHPTFFEFSGDEGKLRYKGPLQMLTIPQGTRTPHGAVPGGLGVRPAAGYLFKPGDTFVPIRGGLYNSKAMKEFQALERLQLKREQMQEQFEDGFK